MKIEERTVGPVQTRCYILSGEDRQDCLIIDPGDEAKRIMDAAGGKTVAAVLLTHGHFDHIGAAREVMGPGTRLFIHREDGKMLGDPALNAGRLFLGRDITAPAPTDYVKDGDEMTLAGLKVRVLHTPGHTPGSVCYLIEDHLFTGDTLFDHGWGRTDLPGGDETQMMRSLRRVMPMAREYPVHAGH